MNRPAAPPARDPARTPPLVLIVDDDRATRELYQLTLENAGYRTLLAASGDEALGALAQDQPGLILLDLKMPGMDGWLAAHLMRNRSDTARVPILVVTGLAPSVENAARRAGATAFCMKPIEPKRLVSEVRRLCPLEPAPAPAARAAVAAPGARW